MQNYLYDCIDELRIVIHMCFEIKDSEGPLCAECAPVTNGGLSFKLQRRN